MNSKDIGGRSANSLKESTSVTRVEESTNWELMGFEATHRSKAPLATPRKVASNAPASSSLSKPANTPKLRLKTNKSQDILEHTNPYKNYSYATTKYLLYNNVMQKAEQIRSDALKEKSQASTGRTLTRQNSPPIEQKVLNNKMERLRKYVNRLEAEKGKNYEDGGGKYRDNLSNKFKEIVSPVVTKLESLVENTEEEDEEMLKKLLSDDTLEPKGETIKAPFDLYSTFEYGHRLENTKEVFVKLANSATKSKPPELKHIKLLKTIDCALERGRNDSLTQKTMRKLLGKTKNVSFEEELNRFVATYFPKNRKVTLMVIYEGR